MELIDYAILGTYLIALAGIGLWLTKRAGQSTEHYFLGGRAMPWWALGASGMASNLDVAGTVTVVALIYAYGIHGFFIEMRGGVVLPIAVFLAFMGKWHRRSQVMTTAEWMILRFGDGTQGRLARAMAALTYLVITVAMTVFFFTAAGRFLAEFVPLSAWTCTLIMAGVAFGYTLLGGLYGVVWTDVFQAGIIGGAAIYVAVLAAKVVSPELLQAWPGARLNDFLPVLSSPALGPYSAFGGFLLVWATKGVLEGLGGSGGSAYMAQRFFAARSDAECQKIGILWTVLFAFRWPMVVGFVVLAVNIAMRNGVALEPERIIPLVLKSDYFPPGLRGMMLAALLAAAMSTFDSTLNAGAAYLVKDIYEPLRRRASERELVWVGYGASVLIVVLGLAIASLTQASVVGVWVNIVMLLFPAFLVPFALRWYWSRFNGAGFAGGVGAGFLVAWLTQTGAFGSRNEAQQFLVIAGCSLAVSVVATFAAAPVPRAILQTFYEKVRPAGWWPSDWSRPHAAEHRRDRARLAVALVWQIATFLLPMAIVLHRWPETAALAGLSGGLGGWLIKNSRS